jgi:hypothetical protein
MTSNSADTSYGIVTYAPSPLYTVRHPETETKQNNIQEVKDVAMKCPKWRAMVSVLFIAAFWLWGIIIIISIYV